MAFRSALAAVYDLDAVIVGRWEMPRAVRRAGIPFVLVLAAALAVLPLALGSGSIVVALVVGGLLAACSCRGKRIPCRGIASPGSTRPARRRRIG